MDLSLEREGTALGSLFQQIINDMKNTSPLWEDFVTKASKLHACLRAAIQAIGAYLDAFQKIADAATNSRGASKEIGTALTRVCLRHKAVETRLKTFTTAIMDCLVQPLQEKLEEWKRTVSSIDKEHAKEYKRCRTELKKRSTDTLRLQKKARKGQSDTLQTLMDSHMQDVTQRRVELEEVEKKSLRCVMVEERMRYCSFVNLLQPVVKEECEFMSELGHLQEAMESIALVTKDPNILPQASEELIHDVKANITLYPESPGGGSGSAGACSNSLGSRKSSVCSISSMNSSGSSNSPGHHHYPRSLSQLIAPSIRLKPGESSDSGFCSTPALTTQASTATAQTSSISTWPPHAQDGASLPPAGDRPHTISTAYEKGHQRPPLTVYTFENPEPIPEGTANTPNETMQSATQKSPANVLNRPPLPVRCSSLERPLAAKPNGNLLQPKQCPSPIPAHVTNEQQQQKHYMQPTPTYVNTSDLANMTALKNTNHQQQQQQKQMQHQHSIDSVCSQNSNDSMSHHTPPQQQNQTPTNTLAQQRSLSISSSSASSSNIASLHSQPSIDSAVATPLVGQTPTPSSGSSTPQNHYSPLINNSDGTPSNASIASGALYTYSSTPPPMQSLVNSGEQVLKTIEENRQKVMAEFNLGEGLPTPAADTDSPTIVENDERSRASVLQKASMFEKQAQACSPSNAAASVRTHKEEERQQLPVESADKSFEDSMVELNNLIGELDLFQREIDASQQQLNNNEPTTDKQQEHLIAETFSITSYASINNNNTVEHKNSNSNSNTELNQLVNDTDGLHLAAGYENPTFAHFEASPGHVTHTIGSHDGSSYISGSNSDAGSAVVVIYDHQIPITPDIDYVKQNSEIVMLRTKDPQQQSQLMPHETRELQQLSPNEYQLSDRIDDDDDDDEVDGNKSNKNVNLATVKQRLSSFRATSDQQIQLLGLKQQQQQKQGMTTTTTTTPTNRTTAQKLLKIDSDRNSLPIKKPNILNERPRAAPKPTLSLTNLTQQQQQQMQQQQQIYAAMKNRINNKFMLKVDLDAKMRKQKERLIKQQQQQQHQLQQQQMQHDTNTLSSSSKTIPTTTDALVVNSRYNHSMHINVSHAHFHHHHHNNQNHPNQNQNQLQQQQQQEQYHNHIRMQQQQHMNGHYQNSHVIHQQNHLNQYPTELNKNNTTTTTTTTTPPSSSSNTNICKTSFAKLNCLSTKCVPVASPVVPSKTTATSTSTNVPKSAATTSKPCILPRPASLTGESGAGGTRIARRASVNAAKPPPPVRRSSSVTPGQNSRTTSPYPVTPPTPPPMLQQPHQQQHQRDIVKRSPLLQHNSNRIYTTTPTSTNHIPTDSPLPPPPAYLLEGQRQTPVSVLPNSTMKVVETVKNLAALRQQPASPIVMRRQPSPQQHLQQQQQQQQHQEQVILQHNPIHQPNLYCATISTTNSNTNYSTDNLYLTREECDYAAYYNPYVEVMHNLNTQTQSQAKLQTQEFSESNVPTAAAAYYSYAKAPLPNYEPSFQISHASNHLNSPPNPIYQPKNSQQLAQQQQRHHRPYAEENEMQQQALLQHQAAQDSDANYGTYMPSFRNTGGNGNGVSGGIYAQPKLVNSMSSFRSSSPSPSNASTPTNGHVHPQPKTNPNLIAQLNARLNSKQLQQQQQHHQQQQLQNEQIYNASNHPTSEQQEPIYMRANYGQQQQQQHQQQQQQHIHQQKQQQQQQSPYEAGSIRAKTKAEFLENLNAKLAKQGISGRAYAVRNLINSKALPNPRICHESLMDQIKRGATLKRNQKINDRSAPKIH